MPETEKYIEKELLFKVAGGDEKAFQKIVEHYAEKTFAHALTFIKGYVLAQETVQDIFLKIWQNKDKLISVESFDDYLFIVSKNHLISVMRKKLVALEGLDDDAGKELFYQPDSQYELKELRHMLEDGIARLPVQRQLIFKMIHQEGLSQKDVADRLGIATRTVRWHLVASINFLRDYLYRKSGNSLLCFLLLLTSLGMAFSERSNQKKENTFFAPDISHGSKTVSNDFSNRNLNFIFFYFYCRF